MSLDSSDLIGLVAVAGGLLIAAIGIVTGMIRRNISVREQEQTKRELAAYVAEGSMTAEDAEKILKGGKKSSHDMEC